ncbi:MAG: Mini-ribonuclease 3 [Patescibacteria group bacterium]
MENFSPTQAAAMPPAVLAYMGDAVFELFVREYLLARGACRTARALHRGATDLVRARAQAAMARALAGLLTHEEGDILRRGRNAHCGHVPAGAEMADYRWATGFESLIGYLYLCGRRERLAELLSRALCIQMPGSDG